jgi:hypothetical protein
MTMLVSTWRGAVRPVGGRKYGGSSLFLIPRLSHPPHIFFGNFFWKFPEGPALLPMGPILPRQGCAVTAHCVIPSRRAATAGERPAHQRPPLVDALLREGGFVVNGPFPEERRGLDFARRLRLQVSLGAGALPMIALVLLFLTRVAVGYAWRSYILKRRRARARDWSTS